MTIKPFALLLILLASPITFFASQTDLKSVRMELEATYKGFHEAEKRKDMEQLNSFLLPDHTILSRAVPFFVEVADK